MKVYELNRPLFDLPAGHPARQFLEAFARCRIECVGREIASQDKAAVDQEWVSAIDGKKWSFSEFAYKFVSFDIELDGWLYNSTRRTESEENALQAIPMLRRLLEECRSAGEQCGNVAIDQMIDQINELLSLWVRCIEARATS